MLAPIVLPGATRPHAIFVAGLNPHREVDEAYLGFVRLFVGQVSASLAGAHAHEEEKRRATALAEIDRAKTTFFSNVSHELRTPLTLLLAPLDEAMNDPSIRESDPASPPRRTSQRPSSAKLVNALLEFSRIEAGRVKASFEPVDLGALTREYASAFESTMAQGGLGFSVVTEDIGDVYVDREMWETIVLNLVSNAFKFTHDGAIEVRVTCDGESAKLVVKDSGVGIADGDVPQLFERFHRVEGRRGRSFEGTGIGLSLVYELVKLHGGRIDVESAIDRGTTFTVTLPLGHAHLDASSLQARAPSERLASRAYIDEATRWLPSFSEAPRANVGTRARVLLADDNADMRDYVARLLSERWDVEAVENGAAALEAIARHRPNVVVSDVMMPGIDGLELLARLRGDPATRSVPMLLLSARAGEEARSEGLASGADDYLVKPFSARELVVRVQQLVSDADERAHELEQRRFLESLVSQAPAAIAVWRGPTHVFELANAAFLELTGVGDVVGKTVREAYGEARPAMLELMEQVYRTGRTYSTPELEVVVAPADGSSRTSWHAFHIAALRDEHNAITGLVEVAIDVTEQVEARRRIEELRKTAENASRAKDDFLNVLSHELRTPLNAIVGWSALIGQKRVASEQIPKAMEAIERNARAQARLIEDMLDLSRIEQGKLVLSVGPVEMVKVIEAAIDVVQPAADAKRVRIQQVLDSHATIVGDADRLQQIAWNLLANAIKFTPAGGRVLVSLRRNPSYVALTVADTGEGIEASFLPQVFDRFRQADPTSKRRAGGLGLGLAIVRSLVEMHGGTVTAKSDGLGLGATFEVRLPTAPLRADRAPISNAEPGVPSQPTFDCPPELADKHFLVVDDEPDTRELLRYLIEQCDARVDTADGATTALRMLGERTYDAIVSDIGMPEIDGFGLIERVRAMDDPTGRIPAVALTAYARAEDRTRMLRAGFDMPIAKPVEPSELLTVLAAVVRKRSK